MHSIFAIFTLFFSPVLPLVGTSMACPHATGVVAQLLQKNPKATPADVQKAMSCDASKGIHEDRYVVVHS